MTLLESLQIKCSKEKELKYSRFLHSIEDVYAFICHLQDITQRECVEFPIEQKKLLEQVVGTTKRTIYNSITYAESPLLVNGCFARIVPNMYTQFGDARTIEYKTCVNFVETQLKTFAVMHGTIPQPPFDPQVQGRFKFSEISHYNVIAIATYMLDILTEQQLPCNGGDIFDACVHLKILPEAECRANGGSWVSSILRRYNFTKLDKDKFLSDHENRVEYALNAQDYYANMLKVVLSDQENLSVVTDETNGQLDNRKPSKRQSVSFIKRALIPFEGEWLSVSGALVTLNPFDPHNSTFVIPHTFEYGQIVTWKDQKKTGFTDMEAYMACFEPCQSAILNDETVYIQDNDAYHACFGSTNLHKKSDIIEALISQSVLHNDLEGEKIKQQQEEYADEELFERRLVLKKAVEELGGSLLNTPPYQSEVQPLETLWKMQKDACYARVYRRDMTAKRLMSMSRDMIDDLAEEYENLGDCVADAFWKMKLGVQILLNSPASLPNVLKAYKKDNNISASDKYPLLIIPIPDTTKYYACRDNKHPLIRGLRKYMKKTYGIKIVKKTSEDMEEEQHINPDNQEVFKRPEVQEFLNSPFPSFCPKECAKYCKEARTRFNMRQPGMAQPRTIIMADKRPRGRPSKHEVAEKQAKVQPNTSASSSKKKK